MDLAAGELRKNGTRIRLQDQPFQILVYLLDRAGEVVTREELRQKLWPADTFVDFDHSLNTAIKKLREALGDSASARAMWKRWRGGDTGCWPRCSGQARNRRCRIFRKRLQAFGTGARQAQSSS